MIFRKTSDEKLVEGIRRSDVASYDAVYRHWFPVLRTFVFGMLKDAAKAEDIAQNVLMKLWLRRESLDPSLSLKNYLFVLAKNEIFNVLKSNAHKLMQYTDNLPERHGSSCSTEENIHFQQTRERIDSLVADMPAKRREVFRLSRCEHLDTEEIARIMGLSPRTVEKHLELALRDLRKRIN